MKSSCASVALSHLSGGHNTTSQSLRSPKLRPCLSAAHAPPHRGGDPSAADTRREASAWTPACQRSKPPELLPAETYNSCWRGSASQFRNACSHQILAESSSPSDLPNICSLEICQFHPVWPLEGYILGMCNSSFPQPGLHRASGLT